MTTRPSEPDKPGSLAKRILDTADVAAGGRLEYWLEMVCSLYCDLECEPPEEQCISGKIEFSRIGDLDFTHLRSNGQRVWRTPQRIRASNQDHCLVIVQREGRGVVQQDGREGILLPGDFAFNDCTRPYELRFDQPHHDLWVLRLPRAEIESHVGNIEELTAIPVPGQSAAGQLLLSMMGALHREIDGVHPSSALGVSAAVSNIIGAGLRSLPGANRRKPSNLAAYHLARIDAFIRQHIRDPALSVGSIAAAMQLSPDYVRKLFRNEPEPVSRLIWKLRLDACRRDLADPRLASRSLSDVAFTWGFSDAAHFSRCFRDQYGISPREWRNEEVVARRVSRVRETSTVTRK